MEDTILANTLERATSTDFNAAQASQARRLSEVRGFDGATHPIPLSPYNGSSLVPATPTYLAVISGLHISRVSDTAIAVGPGSLTQYQPSGVTTPDPTTDFQTGIQRAAVVVNYVSTAGLGLATDATEAWHLLCCRVKEVDVTDDVEIYDPVLQDFDLVSVAKRRELQLEYKWVLGGALDADGTVLPALDAGGVGWEPLAYVSFVHPSGAENDCRVIDVARRIEGLSGGFVGAAAYEAGGNAMALAAALQARLTSVVSPDSLDDQGALAGAAYGEINGNRALFHCSQDQRQISYVDATDGSSPTDWTLVHYYLVPLVDGNANRRWPLRARSVDGETTISHIARGLIVGTTIQPTRKRTNSAAITLYKSPGVRGKWASQSAVAVGQAIYLASGHSFTTNGFNTIYPMVRTLGGSVMYPTGEQNFVDPDTFYRWRCPFVEEIDAYTLPALSALSRNQTIDLRDVVPRIASVVHLHIEMLEDSDFEQLGFEIRNRVDDPLNAIAGISLGSGAANCGSRLAVGMLAAKGATASVNHPGIDIRVPTGWVPSANHTDASIAPIDAYHFWLQLRIFSLDAVSASPKTMGKCHVRVTGWEE